MFKNVLTYLQELKGSINKGLKKLMVSTLGVFLLSGIISTVDTDIFQSSVNQQLLFSKVEAATTFQATAYSHQEAGNNYTADGTYIGDGSKAYTICASNYFRLGTLLYIECPSYPSVNGTYRVADRGGMSSNVVDLLLPTISDCYSFGRRKIYVTVVS